MPTMIPITAAMTAIVNNGIRVVGDGVTLGLGDGDGEGDGRTQ